MSDRIATLYHERVKTFARREDKFRARAVVLATLRRFCNWSIAGCLLLGGLSDTSVMPWLLAGFSLLAISLATDFAYERCAIERDRNRGLRRINQNAIARIDRNWEALPFVEMDLTDDEAAIADDLDLFGRASLFQMICTANTSSGIRTLRDWLLQPAPTAEISRRQQAVAELAPQLEFRQELNSRCRMLAEGQFAIENYLEWVEGGGWLSRQPLLKWLVRILPVLAIAIPALVLTNLTPASIGMPFFVAVIALNFAITILFGGKVHDL
jgi:hypothetical protein